MDETRNMHNARKIYDGILCVRIDSCFLRLLIFFFSSEFLEIAVGATMANLIVPPFSYSLT